MRSKTRDTALLLVTTPREASSTHNSASVTSDFSVTRSFSHSMCPSSGERRPPACGFTVRRPSARYACIHFTAVEALTSKTFA